MSKTFEITRRTALRGIGTAVALPLLDAMLPSLANAAADGAKPPLRMAFVYVPNGKHMPDWTPRAEGAKYDLPWILEPLQPSRDDICVLTGLTHQKAAANGDGGGDHARALTTFLTGTQARKTHGADIRAGISVDQVAAREVGQHTRFASLEIGCDAGAQSGNCDSGYSCAYSCNIAWKSETSPSSRRTIPGSSSNASSPAAAPANRPPTAPSASATTRASSTSSRMTRKSSSAGSASSTSASSMSTSPAFAISNAGSRWPARAKRVRPPRPSG